MMVKYLMILALVASHGRMAVSQREPTTHQGTTVHIMDIFYGRCLDYNEIRKPDLLPSVQMDCSTLWKDFFEAFSYQPPCAVNREQYGPYVRGAMQSLPKDKVMFWSGVYSLAHRYAENGKNYVTLEDTLAGYLVNSLTWCGQGGDPGMNYTRCPDWNDCPSEASESFWAAASTAFASGAKGDVILMVDGSNPGKPAYRQDSFFGKYELPNLNLKEVTAAHAIVVHALDKPTVESCNQGSLVTLMNDVTARGLKFTCEDDPDAVLHLLCSDDPESRECKLASQHQAGQLSYEDEPWHFNKIPDTFA